MKTQHTLFALLASGIGMVSAETSGEMLSIIFPNGGTVYSGGTLAATWRHQPEHAGNTVLLSASLIAENPLPGNLKSMYSLTHEERVAVLPAIPAETRVWNIPADIMPGIYRLEIVESPENYLFLPFSLLAHDRSDTLVIKPRSIITLSRRTSGNRIPAGTSPEFRFTITAWGTNSTRAFLTKDGRLVGQLWGAYIYGSGTASFTWSFTQYANASGKHIAAAGEGYQIVIGILGADGYPEDAAAFMDAFESFDATEPFAIVGTAKPIIVWKGDSQDSFFMAIIGAPRARYKIYYTPVIEPARWETSTANVQADADGIWFGLVERKGSMEGYFYKEDLFPSVEF